jgi:hypothetical protein
MAVASLRRNSSGNITLSAVMWSESVASKRDIPAEIRRERQNWRGFPGFNYKYDRV